MNHLSIKQLTDYLWHFLQNYKGDPYAVLKKKELELLCDLLNRHYTKEELDKAKPVLYSAVIAVNYFCKVNSLYSLTLTATLGEEYELHPTASAGE